MCRAKAGRVMGSCRLPSSLKANSPKKPNMGTLNSRPNPTHHAEPTHPPTHPTQDRHSQLYQNLWPRQHRVGPRGRPPPLPPRAAGSPPSGSVLLLPLEEEEEEDKEG